MKIYYLLIIMLVLSCSYLKEGHLTNKRIDKSYYEIINEDDRTAIYRTEARSYIDSDGKIQILTDEVFSHYRYNGTNFVEKKFETLYIIEVKGYPKNSEKIMMLEFITDKNTFDSLDKGQLIKLKDKDSLLVGYNYTLLCDHWRNSIITNKVYIDGRNKNANIQKFKDFYEKDWINKRGK